jgi:F-type H+-transporting ATPase subunit a
VTPLFALEFPPISHLIEWPDMFLKGSPFAINKVSALFIIAAVLVFAFYMIAGRQQRLVPSGAQNVAESAVDFVRNGVILETLGPSGMGWTPFLLTLFSFIFVGNLFEIIPVVQMPVNARMAFPAFMAIVVWFIYNFLGIKHQGLIGYFRTMLFPPGVPKFLYILVTPIELISGLVMRPFSLAVRLFANMLAGHLLLVTFAVLCAELFRSTVVGFILPFPLLVALTGFEVLVAFLQAFIFTILTAVYINGAVHPEH